MNARPLAFVGAALLALAATPASAQQPLAPQQRPALAGSVGHWLYDDRGEIIGSVKSLAPDGHTAVVALGIYFRDYVRLVAVPADALRVVDGKAMLRGETVQVLLNTPARGG